MKKVLLTIIFFSSLSALMAQQFYVETFLGLSKSNYDNPSYLLRQNHLNAGARLAVGADHFQVGAEYSTNLTDPTFDVDEMGTKIGTDTYSETYSGGFIRTKISKFPAQRFGLVLMAGGGVYTTTAQVKRLSVPDASLSYKKYPGLNAGMGFSIPTFRYVMLELAYSYHFVKRPELPPYLPKYNASSHCFSAGLSLNLVFGKRAKEYPPFRGK